MMEERLGESRIIFSRSRSRKQASPGTTYNILPPSTYSSEGGGSDRSDGGVRSICLCPGAFWVI